MRTEHYRGNTAMGWHLYLAVTAASLGVLAVAALPLWLAALVRLITRKSPKRRSFIWISGALSYGFTCFVALLFIPFFLVGTAMSAQLANDGHKSWEAALDVITKYSLVTLLGTLVVCSFVVPIYLSRNSLNWSAPPSSNNPAGRT